MYRGYVKLWRKLIDAGWLKQPKLCAFWIWCLLKASHKEMDIIVGSQKVHIMPGDFIFGLNTASKELKMPMQPIRTCLAFLKTSQNITIKTTNKYSVISIINWSLYQSDENEINKPLTNKTAKINKPLTNKQQTKVTDIIEDSPLFTETLFEDSLESTNKTAKINNKQECINKNNKKNNIIYSADFLSFWECYPNKKEKPHAFNCWNKLNGQRPDLEVIQRAIQKQKDWRKNADGAFRPEWKHPAVWLNKGCWDDIPEVEKEKSRW
jgi:hypothetical protein